jgi:hypothetical protein
MTPILAAAIATLAITASSTSSTSFELFDGRFIFVPATINGRASTVRLLTGGGSYIDKTFAASLGIRDSVATVDVTLGDVALSHVKVSVVDLESLAKRIGHPMPVLIGDEAFNAYAVDIDFERRRITFRDPAQLEVPAGAVEVPLPRVKGVPVVPISIEDGPSKNFWFGLGNSGEILIYQSYYDAAKLLEQRRQSLRAAAGLAGVVSETVAVVHGITFAGTRLGEMPAAFVPRAITGAQSDSVYGQIGLPILSRFRLVVDYSHDRLYATPYRDATRAPFEKDRLGMVVVPDDSVFTVTFVAPHSPAEGAGYKVGDRLVAIDGRPPKRWARPALADLRYGAAGRTVTLTTADGNVRQVTLTDYF